MNTNVHCGKWDFPLETPQCIRHPPDKSVVKN